MLQLNVQPYASDALEDAMRLAQTKALNSYSFSDMFNYLNYTWMDMYQQIAFVDQGYYSVTIRLTRKLTKLPVCVKNSILVFAAQTTSTYHREVYRHSGMNDLTSPCTYHISGFDLYCPDAERRTIWLTYTPQQKQIFFTMNNRDPRLFLDWDKMPAKVQSYTPIYNMYQFIITDNPAGIWMNLGAEGTLTTRKQIVARFRNVTAGIPDVDVTASFSRGDDWSIISFLCDFPYIFVTYKNNITDEYWSGFYQNVINDGSEWTEFNPFAFTGRNSNVEYLQAKWNDKTGLGVIVKDHNDIQLFRNPLYDPNQPEGPGNEKETLQPRVKELGWTPDTLLNYPGPEMYRLLVARLADKLAALNESNVMGVQKELVEAEFAFKNFLGKNKSAWNRIHNVNGPTITDYL